MIRETRGEDEDDQYGSGGLTVLTNGNLVVTSFSDIVEGVSNVGSVTLVDGESGFKLNTITGDNASDYFGSTDFENGVFAPRNGNYAIISDQQDSETVTDAGSLILVSGTSGEQIGETLFGENSDDFRIRRAPYRRL